MNPCRFRKHVYGGEPLQLRVWIGPLMKTWRGSFLPRPSLAGHSIEVNHRFFKEPEWLTHSLNTSQVLWILHSLSEVVRQLSTSTSSIHRSIHFSVRWCPFVRLLLFRQINVELGSKVFCLLSMEWHKIKITSSLVTNGWTFFKPLSVFIKIYLGHF